MLVRLIREAGGHGDVIRCLSVARAIKEAMPSSEVWFYGVKNYAFHAKLCPDVDGVFVAPWDQRVDRDKPLSGELYSHLNSPRPFDASVGLFCPAWRAEKDHFPHFPDRILSFVRAGERELKCSLVPRAPRVVVPRQAQENADKLLESFGCDLSKDRLVAVAPVASSALRYLPAPVLRALVLRLSAENYDVIVLANKAKICEAALDGLSVPIINLKPFQLVYGVMKRVKMLFCSDSGPLHAAAAVGARSFTVLGPTGGPYLCGRYDAASWIQPAGKHFNGLGCQSPCYYVAYWDQLRACKEAGRCEAMHRMDVDVVVERALEALVA